MINDKRNFSFHRYPKDKCPPRCQKQGCNAQLTSRDIAFGYKFCGEECYTSSMCDFVTQLFDEADED